MFNFFKNFIEGWALKSFKRELENYIQRLKSLSNNSKGSLVVLVTFYRFHLDEHGIMGSDIFEKHRRISTEDQALIALELTKLCNEFSKRGQKSDASALGVWLHSIRALTSPELAPLAKVLWKELSKGFPHTEDVITATNSDLAAQGASYSSRVLSNLHYIPPPFRSKDQPPPASTPRGIIECENCGTKNRVSLSHFSNNMNPVCGNCKNILKIKN